MDVNYINPILEAFSNVIPQVGLGSVSRKGVAVKNGVIEGKGVVIILGIVGDIKGNIIYSISMDSAKNIASKMMMGMPVDEFNELAQSAISELTNMLTANVATNFSNQGINVNISTPALIHGDFSTNASTDKVICVTMAIENDEVDVNISLEKTC